jgi:hypothetical protein
VSGEFVLRRTATIDRRARARSFAASRRALDVFGFGGAFAPSVSCCPFIATTSLVGAGRAGDHCRRDRSIAREK